MITFNISDRFPFLKTGLEEALRTVMDPELHINIVDLGLIYRITLQEDELLIQIIMTLSSKSCPMGESILTAVKNCVERLFPSYTAELELVWEPEWNYDFITPAGIKMLRGN